MRKQIHAPSPSFLTRIQYYGLVCRLNHCIGGIATRKSPPTKEKKNKIKGFNAIKRVVWKFVV